MPPPRRRTAVADPVENPQPLSPRHDSVREDAEALRAAVLACLPGEGGLDDATPGAVLADRLRHWAAAQAAPAAAGGEEMELMMEIAGLKSQLEKAQKVERAAATSKGEEERVAALEAEAEVREAALAATVAEARLATEQLAAVRATMEALAGEKEAAEVKVAALE